MYSNISNFHLNTECLKRHYLKYFLLVVLIIKLATVNLEIIL